MFIAFFRLYGNSGNVLTTIQILEAKENAAGQEEMFEKQDDEDGDEDEDKIQPDVNPITVQRELLRCIEENEVVSCMVGPVKISGQALHAFDAGGKKGKRSCNKPKRKKK